MFGRKKTKAPTEPDYTKKPVLPSKLAKFVQVKYGLAPDELQKLFVSIARENKDIKVNRNLIVAGKEYPKQVGKPLDIAEAAEYEKERAENWQIKEEKIQELIDEREFHELRFITELDESLYPQKLEPVDIVRCVDAAKEKLEELERKRNKPPKIYSVRDELVLDAITLIKKQEPLRLARLIAARQKGYLFSKSMEELEYEYSEWLRELRGDPTEEELLAMQAAEEEQRLEEERLAAEEAARNFEDLATVHTLLDDVAELIRNNPEAAAAIIGQWIGNAVLMESKSG